MQTFTLELTTDEYGPCSFHFSRLYTAEGVVYYVSTGNGALGGHTFAMVPKTVGGWRIINAPKVPDWIESLENELSNAIMINGLEV